MVKVGQVWADCDKRSEGRHIKVIEVITTKPWTPAFAICVGTSAPFAPGGPPLLGTRETRITLDRFKPGSTGYRLVKDV